jgi:hypothetical protein
MRLVHFPESGQTLFSAGSRDREIPHHPVIQFPVFFPEGARSSAKNCGEFDRGLIFPLHRESRRRIPEAELILFRRIGTIGAPAASPFSPFQTISSFCL